MPCLVETPPRKLLPFCLQGIMVLQTAAVLFILVPALYPGNISTNSAIALVTKRGPKAEWA